MTPLLVIIGVIVVLRVVAGMMTSEDEPAPAAPTSVPPRPRVRRRAAPPPLPAGRPGPAADDEGPEVAPAASAVPAAVVPRPAPPASRQAAKLFRGRDDLRRAVVMREVLGRPLSLR